jgi:BCD family chlorophyll transporter-like MFS transporter
VSRNEIIRLSLIRFATSFLVILIVGILNRIMIVEFGIDKILVGTILAFQHLITPVALFFGYLSDTRPIRNRRRTPYIVIGMVLCCLPMPFLPDLARIISESGNYALFALVGILALVLFGIGVAVSSLALHALIIDRCPPQRRGEALTTVWIITLVGFIIAAPIYAWVLPVHNLDVERIVFLAAAFAAILFTLFGIWRQEQQIDPLRALAPDKKIGLLKILSALWANPQARVLFSFLALADFFFFMQEYVLEAFGEEVFRLSLAHTTAFNLYFGVGILISMIGFNSLLSLVPSLSEKKVLAIGCVVSSASFLMLGLSSLRELEAVILIAVFVMGFGKGIFNVGLARMMMRASRVDIGGLIMGLWAVVGGVAIGLGELGGGVVVELGFRVTGNTPLSYGILFFCEAVGLLLCLALIATIDIHRFHGRLESTWPAPAAGITRT